MQISNWFCCVSDFFFYLLCLCIVQLMLTWFPTLPFLPVLTKAYWYKKKNLLRVACMILISHRHIVWTKHVKFLTVLEFIEMFQCTLELCFHSCTFWTLRFVILCWPWLRKLWKQFHGSYWCSKSLPICKLSVRAEHPQTNAGKRDGT